MNAKTSLFGWSVVQGKHKDEDILNYGWMWLEMSSPHSQAFVFKTVCSVQSAFTILIVECLPVFSHAVLLTTHVKHHNQEKDE